MKQKIQDSRYSNKNYNPRQHFGWLYGSRTDALEKISNKTLRAMDVVTMDYGNGRRKGYLNRPREMQRWGLEHRFYPRPNVVVNFPDPDPRS